MNETLDTILGLAGILFAGGLAICLIYRFPERKHRQELREQTEDFRRELREAAPEDRLGVIADYLGKLPDDVIKAEVEKYREI